MSLAVVAVAFDEQTPALVRSAVTLAERFGVDLRIVHVIETVAADAVLADLPLYGVSPALVTRAQQRERQESNDSMQRLLADLPQNVRVSSAVLTGDAVRSIISDAITHGAAFIMSACSPDSYGRLMPKGFSKALSLLSEAPMPVLVMSRARPLDVSKPQLRILLADDLQSGTLEAARKAFELAVRLGAGTSVAVRQVHVHGNLRELLRDAWMDITASRRTVPDEPLADSPEALLLQEYEARIVKLKQRGGAARAGAESAGVKIEVDVRTGDVASEIHDAVQDFDPDLLVFGRHRLLKTRPFLIGRMPLQAMLREGRPVLVVPPHEDFYAPITL